MQFLTEIVQVALIANSQGKTAYTYSRNCAFQVLLAPLTDATSTSVLQRSDKLTIWTARCVIRSFCKAFATPERSSRTFTSAHQATCTMLVFSRTAECTRLLKVVCRGCFFLISTSSATQHTHWKPGCYRHTETLGTWPTWRGDSIKDWARQESQLSTRLERWRIVSGDCCWKWTPIHCMCAI